MGLKIYMNGKMTDKEHAKISVFDHGLLYGDGVFEGIRAYSGRVFRLRDHMERLYDSARAIRLTIPMTIEELEKAVIATLRINKLKDAYIRLVITRGNGDLGLDPDKCSEPSIIIITDKIKLYPEAYYKKGLEIVTVSTRKNSHDTLSPSIKSLNYLNNILAKIEAKLCNAQEAIMLNKDGYVTECTGDNIFIIKNGELLTPPSYVGILNGITRKTVMKLAVKKLAMTVKEELFTQFHMYTANECFLTGTGAEVIPVIRIDDRIIGDGKPGKYTIKLITEFRKLTTSEGVEVFR
jgi:branched-chain amino acid aminotransferase